MGARHVSVLAGLVVLLFACSSTVSRTVSPQAVASGATVMPLAGGRLPSLPTGTVYIRLIHFAQPALYSIPSQSQTQQHKPGFIYMEAGTQRLFVVDQPPKDIGEGEATFLNEVTHWHYNPGPSTISWYFIALWPTSFRTQQLIDPQHAKVAFATPDLGPATMPPGSYVQVLRRVTLAPGGRTSAHTFGGYAVLFVLEGSVTVRATGAGAVTVAAGNGKNYTAGTGQQELNVTSEPAVFLELLTVADGAPFETQLTAPPVA